MCYIGLQSLHDDNCQDRSIVGDDKDEVRYDNEKVSSRLESKSILTIASGQNHSVCATANNICCLLQFSRMCRSKSTRGGSCSLTTSRYSGSVGY